MKRYIIAVAGLTLLVVSGFFLPPQLMKWQDERSVEESKLEKTEEIMLAPQSAMSLTEKLNLYIKDTANTMGLVNGKNYDENSIKEKVLEEIRILNDMGILNPASDTIGYYMEAEAGFVVDTEDSTQSMNIWTVYMYAFDQEYNLQLMVDDETGKILSICQTYMEPYTNVQIADAVTEVKPEEVYTESLEAAAKKWGEYLGIDFVETYENVIGTMDVDTEFQREVEALVKAGMSEAEAHYTVLEMWGITEEYSEHHLCSVYEDEGGRAIYLLRKNIGNIVFSTELYN